MNDPQPYITEDANGETWRIMLGDSCERLAEIPDNSVDLSIYSPPFASLYTYSPSDRDLGNSSNTDEFIEHYRFVLDHMLRITKPGRTSAVHVQQVAILKNRAGYVGLQDFRGAVIQAHLDAGWIYYGEVTVDKNPQLQAVRTKAQGLMFVQLRRDSALSRPALADYVLIFHKPGDNEVPIQPDISNETWIEWASPVWYGIPEMSTLNPGSGSEAADERHVCLAAGSLVLTRDGHIPIEEVEVGTDVLTHEGRWMPVVDRRCNGIEPVIRTTGQGVADLRTTRDHLLWTRVGTGKSAKAQAMKATPEWVAAEDALGSYLNLKLPPIEDSPLTETECWIIGRWLGDGHRLNAHRRSGKRGGVGQFSISCSHAEEEGLRERLGQYAGYTGDPGTAIQITLKDLPKHVRTVLDRCGHGASGKRVPGELLALDADRSEALLDGYLSADGHYVESYDRMMASSVSRALLLGMAMVAQRARGVVASVYAGRAPGKTTIQGRIVETKQDWIFGFRNSMGYRPSGWIGDDGAWKKVRRSEAAGYAEVWDLQVAGDSSFTAEGAVVHNCPLQLPLIERAVRLWSNPGEMVCSPFTGIGSEGFVAVKHGRRFIGCELKPSYWATACDNLARAEREANMPTLLDELSA